MTGLGGVRPYGLVVFLTAFALLNGQIAVTRLLSYPLFYHFVFFVVSLAQLGLASAGAWVYASRRTSWSRTELAGWLTGLAASTLLVMLAYGAWVPAATLSFAKLDGPPAYRYLVQIAVPLVLFNLCGGMVLTILFTSFKAHIGRLYATDLIGAGLGCVASVGLMMAFGPPRAFVASGAAAALGGLHLLSQRDQGRPDRRVAVALGLASVGLALAWANPGWFDPARRQTQLEPVIRSDWNHIARTDATAPGRYVIDGDALTDVAKGGRRPLDPEYLLVPKAPSVAIVGVGAGPQLRIARGHQASRVLAIDINPSILRWNTTEDAAFNNRLFLDPSIEIAVGDGRHELRASQRAFDLIVMHAIDTYTASAQGAYALSENFLYTVEAMEDFLSRLEPGGVISIQRWLFWPPRENMRLFVTVFEALERAGVAHPEQHVVLLSPTRNYRDPDSKVWGVLLFSNRPFDAERLGRLDAYVARRELVYLFRPGRTIPSPFADFVAAADRSAFYASYPYVIRPATDRNPFFFQFMAPWSSRTSGTHRYDQVLYGQSSDLLLLCLAVSFGLSVLLLGVPLWIRRRDLLSEPQWSPSLAYFACLGLGFMAFELPAIQVMTLFLGHPTYALSVVLLGLLVSAGIGSQLAGKASVTAGRRTLGVIALLALLSSQLLLPLVHAAIELPDVARFAITLAYLVVIGVPLGVPFVAGIKLLDEARPARVAWAWAVNGAAAVVGTTLLMVLMVYQGSDATFGLAAVCYTAALLVYPRLERAGAGSDPEDRVAGVDVEGLAGDGGAQV